MYDKFKNLSNFDVNYVNFNPNIYMDEKMSFNYTAIITFLTAFQ